MPSIPAILVLGAGRDQIFLIKTAKKMNLIVYCVDKQKDAPGAYYADKFFNISSRDILALKTLINALKNTQYPVSGVITMGSDIPHVVAELSDYAGTPTISLQSANWAKNKLEMKERFKSFGVSTPRFVAVSSYSELKNSLYKFKHSSIVLKPIDQAGSRGVNLTTKDSEELEKLYYSALSKSKEKVILIEEFIPGPQISTEHVVYNGRIYTPGFADRNYDDMEKFLPQILENGGWVPSLYENCKNLIEIEIQKAVKAINLNNCIVKGDIVLKNSKPMIIEVAARLSGGDFSESLVPLGSGVNYVKTAIELCIGNIPSIADLQETSKKTVANRYFFAKKGTLSNINVKFDPKELFWLKKFELWIKPGEKIENICSHGQRSGVFVVIGSDRNDLLEKINFIYENVEFIYDEK